MKLNNLRVRNIASYRDAFIDFDALEYPIFISGATGSGKTTLFVDAITAALYGECYGVGRRLREIVSMDKKKGRIELTFSIGDSKYKVTREIWIDKTEETYLKRYLQGEVKSYIEGPRAVNKMILNMLGFDYTGLLNSCIIRQGEVYRFILAKPFERRNILVDLFKLGLERYRERIRNRKESLEKKMRDIEKKETEIKTIISEKERVLSQLEALKTEKMKLEKTHMELSREEEKIDRDFNIFREELDRLHEEIGVYEMIAKKKEEWESELREKEEIIAGLNSKLEKWGIDLSTAKDILSSGIRIYELQDLAKKKGLLEEIIDIIKGLREKDSAEQKYRETSLKLEEINSSIMRLKEEVKIISDSLDKISRAGDKCPICEQPLTDKHKNQLVEEYNNKIASAEQKIKDLLSEKGRVDKELEDITQKLKRLEIEEEKLKEKLSIFKLEYRGKETIEECRSMKSSYDKKYNDLLMQLKKIFNTENIEEMMERYTHYEKYRKEIDEYFELAEKIASIKNNILEAKEKIEAIEKKIAKFESTKKKLNNLKNELEKIRNEKTQVSNRIGEVDGSLKLLDERYQRILSKEKELRDIEKEKSLLRVDISALSILDDAFSERGIPTFLLNRYLEQLEDYSNMYLEEFGLPLSLEFRLSYEKDRQKIDMIAYRSGVADDIVTFSGGETALLGFAVRLAMNRLVSEALYSGYRPKFIIIDEGFGAMDTELRKKVVYALESLMELGEYEQIIIISHQEDLMDEPIFRNVIKVFKEDGYSRLEIIYRD